MSMDNALVKLLDKKRTRKVGRNVTIVPHSNSAGCRDRLGYRRWEAAHGVAEGWERTLIYFDLFPRTVTRITSYIREGRENKRVAQRKQGEAIKALDNGPRCRLGEDQRHRSRVPTVNEYCRASGHV
jgi:hypothetical protein